MNKERDTLKKLSVSELREKVNELRQALFTLRINATTAHVKDYSQFKKLRKNLARALTFIRQKEAR